LSQTMTSKSATMPRCGAELPKASTAILASEPQRQCIGDLGRAKA
jgi:hypothetical protein